MQYATTSINDRLYLIDANEIRALDAHRDSIKDETPGLNESEHPYYVAYGAYLSQPKKSKDESIADFVLVRDHWLGYIDDDLCRQIAFHDAIAFDPIKFGSLVKIPFAALIQAMPPVIERLQSREHQAISCFLRYDGMTPALNVYNRPGVIAVKRLEKRIKSQVVNPQTWQTHVYPDRAQQTAKGIV